jgi:cell division protein FtsW
MVMSRVVPIRRLPMEQKVLVGAIGGLCVIGLPMVLAASDVLSIDAGQAPYALLEKQSLFLALGLLVAFVASRIPLEQMRRWNIVGYFGVILMLGAVLVPGIGQNAGGASRWIPAGPLQIQPSEFMKPAMVLFAADMLARRGSRPDHWRAVVRPMAIALIVAAGLIMMQPDLGTAIVVSCVVLVLLFASGVPFRLLALTFGGGGLVAVYYALRAPYRRDRLLSFVNPFAHANSTGYQVVQSLSALGMGGAKGSGIGGSASTWGFLPNAQTDFVFSVVGSNLGIAGSLAVISLFGLFAWAGLRVAFRETDPFTRYVALGITTWICVQAVINVGGAIDALPVTGIPLPFISYGGSALIVELAGAGMLYGISRRQGLSALVPEPRPSRRLAGAPAA